MRKIRKERGSSATPESILKQVTSLLKGETIIVVNNIPGENETFVSLRKAAEYLGINQSYLAKSIKEQKFYFGKGFLVYKSLTNLEEIIESEAYKEAVTKGNISKTKLRHSEASKELIRQSNIGKKLSSELKQKLSLNSKNAKSVLVTNNETMEKYWSFLLL